MNRVVSICPDPLLSHTDLTPTEVRRKVAKAVARWVFQPTVRYVTQEEMAQFHPPDCVVTPHLSFVHVAIDPSQHRKVSMGSDDVEGVPLDAKELVMVEQVEEDVIETLVLEELFGKYPAHWPKL